MNLVSNFSFRLENAMTKTAHIALFLLLLFSACTPAPTPQTTQAMPTPTLPTSMQTLEACGFLVNYPPQLTPKGKGHQVTFLAPDSRVSVSIQVRRRDPSEGDSSLEMLALHLQVRHFPEMSSLSYKPINIIDDQQNTLPGLQRDIAKNGIYTRLIVFVRPNTMIANLLPADAIYEMVAQAPETDWATWKPVLDEIINSWQPRNCSGG
jgi:hypothetical protein